MKEIKLKIRIKYHFPGQLRWGYRGAKRLPVYHYANITRTVTVNSEKAAKQRDWNDQAYNHAFDYIYEKHPSAVVDNVTSIALT